MTPRAYICKPITVIVAAVAPNKLEFLRPTVAIPSTLSTIPAANDIHDVHFWVFLMASCPFIRPNKEGIEIIRERIATWSKIIDTMSVDRTPRPAKLAVVTWPKKFRDSMRTTMPAIDVIILSSLLGCISVPAFI
ncbi:MAG: hypothetical protein SA339_13190 [Methanomassiliicoccus sp.]|nr:hypothetical protein [Methanomassiliicoccus sp.]